MSPWVSLLLEAVMAVLMTALIVYCVRLNRRLSLLRNQDTEIRELIGGLRDASERAEQSVQRLKAAGLAAERSLRTAIEDAAAARTELSGLTSVMGSRDRSDAPREKPPTSVRREAAPAPKGHAAPDQRDMLMGAAASAAAQAPVPPAAAAPAAVRPRTREEAEESVIQAIRSARGEV